MLRAGQRIEFGPEHICSLYVLRTNPQHPKFQLPNALPSHTAEPMYCGLPLHYWLTILQGDDNQARVKALNMLRCMGTEASEAIPALLKLLKDENIQVSVPAAQLLSQIGSAAIPTLLEMLASTYVSARWGAIYALGEIGLAEFAPSLKARLHDENAEVREVAAKALAKLG